MRQTFCALRAAAAFCAGVAAAGALAQDTTVEKVSIKAVTRFGFAQADLAQKEQSAILAEVGEMKDVTWQSVTATGHTDSVGPAGVNQRLSRERAAAVKAYLVGKGLDPAMISTAGKAAALPVASNDTPDGRAQNRRTEIEFQGIRTAPVPR